MENNNHKILLEGRKRLVLEGVSEVVSFDELTVILDTNGGRLTINGEELHVKKLCLEEGSVEIDGRVDELCYDDGKEVGRRRLFGRARG